jgi:hypothetical protein
MTRIGGLQEESTHMSQIMTPPKIWIFTLKSCPSMFVNYEQRHSEDDDAKKTKKQKKVCLRQEKSRSRTALTSVHPFTYHFYGKLILCPAEMANNIMLVVEMGI